MGRSLHRWPHHRCRQQCHWLLSLGDTSCFICTGSSPSLSLLDSDPPSLPSPVLSLTSDDSLVHEPHRIDRKDLFNKTEAWHPLRSEHPTHGENSSRARGTHLWRESSWRGTSRWWWESWRGWGSDGVIWHLLVRGQRQLGAVRAHSAHLHE
jgi:hypothetical protein